MKMTAERKEAGRKAYEATLRECDRGSWSGSLDKVKMLYQLLHLKSQHHLDIIEEAGLSDEARQNLWGAEFKNWLTQRKAAQLERCPSCGCTALAGYESCPYCKKELNEKLVVPAVIPAEAGLERIAALTRRRSAGGRFILSVLMLALCWYLFRRWNIEPVVQEWLASIEALIRNAAVWVIEFMREAVDFVG